MNAPRHAGRAVPGAQARRRGTQSRTARLLRMGETWAAPATLDAPWQASGPIH